MHSRQTCALPLSACSPPCWAFDRSPCSSGCAVLAMLREKPPGHPGDICLSLLSSPTQNLTRCEQRLMTPKTKAGGVAQTSNHCWAAGDRSCHPVSLCPATTPSPAAGASPLWGGDSIWHSTVCCSVCGHGSCTRRAALGLLLWGRCSTGVFGGHFRHCFMITSSESSIGTSRCVPCRCVSTRNGCHWLCIISA